MNRTFEVVVRNYKHTPRTTSQTRQPATLTDSLPDQEQDQLFGLTMYPADQHLQRLRGNIRMLQKRFKDNLKEGFQHKIMTYRLQAAAQRVMLKEVVKQKIRVQEAEQLAAKLEQRRERKEIDDQRATVYLFRKRQADQFCQKRNRTQQKKVNLMLYQNREKLELANRKMHDSVMYQQSHSDRKRNFLQQLRRASLKRDKIQCKRDLLDRIHCNTERLKTLKVQIEQIQRKPDNTFLTLN